MPHRPPVVGTHQNSLLDTAATATIKNLDVVVVPGDTIVVSFLSGDTKAAPAAGYPSATWIAGGGGTSIPMVARVTDNAPVSEANSYLYTVGPVTQAGTIRVAMKLAVQTGGIAWTHSTTVVKNVTGFANPTRAGGAWTLYNMTTSQLGSAVAVALADWNGANVPLRDSATWNAGGAPATLRTRWGYIAGVVNAVTALSLIHI